MDYLTTISKYDQFGRRDLLQMTIHIWVDYFYKLSRRPLLRPGPHRDGARAQLRKQQSVALVQERDQILHQRYVQFRQIGCHRVGHIKSVYTYSRLLPGAARKAVGGTVPVGRSGHPHEAGSLPDGALPGEELSKWTSTYK